MADYKLNVTSESDCEVILPAGSDFVRTLYPESKCVALISAAGGKVEKSADFDGFLKVGNGELYVSGKLGKASKVADAESAPEEKPVKKTAKKK